MSFIEVDDLFINLELVVAIKRVGKNKSAVFMTGSSPIDGGFLVEKDALELATDIIEELQYDEPDDEEE